MSKELDRAAYYQNKAGELRAVARDGAHELTRDVLLRAAETYERLAGNMKLIREAKRQFEL